MKGIKIITFAFAICCANFNLLSQTTTSLGVLQDSYVDSRLASTNFGSDTNLHVNTYQFKFGSFYFRRSFIEFDLSTIPPNAVIHSAKIVLKRSSAISGSNPFKVKRVTSSWVESTIRHAVQPTISTLSEDISSSYTQSNDTLFFDVTAMTQRMIYGSADNYGWSIQVNNEALTSGSGCSFYSSESSYVPVLLVEYYLPITVSSALIKHESYDGASNGSINPSITGGTGSYAYVWTEGSSGDTIGTGSSISGLPYGWYGLNVTGAYGEELYYAFLIGVDCDTVEILFDPGPNFVADAFIYDLNATEANKNFGSYSVWLTSDATSGGIWYDAKSLAKFQLWADENLDYESANLKLTGSTIYRTDRDNSARFKKISSYWDEYQLTFNSQPSYIANDTIFIPQMTSNTEIKYIDFAQFWEQWKLDNTTNYGMLFELRLFNNTYAKQQYYSSDHATTSYHPEVTFEIYTHNPAHPVCNPDMVPYKEVTKHPGSGYASAWNNEIRFAFDEEYDRETGSYLDFTLYDDDRTLLASCSSAGSTTGGIAAIPVNFDDNRYIIDLSALSLTPGDFYQIEVNNTKGDTYYLRFIYKN